MAPPRLKKRCEKKPFEKTEFANQSANSADQRANKLISGFLILYRFIYQPVNLRQQVFQIFIFIAVHCRSADFHLS